MKFYRMLSEDIRYNLATEEYLMNNVDVSEPCLLLYIQKPCVIIGRNQNAYQEIDFDYLRNRKIVLTRRTSGGGAVYDDLGNMSFSFVTKKDATSFGDYQSATQPIMKGLAAMGAKDVEVHGRNDLFIDGKKFSGNAMYTKKGRTYSHGTLMYDVDLEELTKVLHVAQEKIASKATKSVRKSVTNIKPFLAEQYQSMDTKEFRDTLLCRIYEVESIDEISEQEIVLTETDRQAIQTLFEERYANNEWIFNEAPAFEWQKRKRFEQVGIVEVDFTVNKGKIAAIQISGDFFGQKEISELEAMLQGIDFEKSTISRLLEGIAIDQFIHQMTASEFLALLFD
ncbi:lipoate--protein ligase [Enterococcus entomosocium]|uniref:lipoate--protein ligase n=3 Tax=Enterococcus entomosocium TaxID=3034352 RepID=A0ABV3MGW2_9ENTE|nr:lipoate--protein ligase [Enterococcus casseliflavus]MDB1709894.1 lipoate--protein ligase [Enterococcus casseliflavus]MDB1717808.1 lipoate--protein ligase [Enterococcus casseliflavus]